MVLVKKKNGSYRMCIDYRRLNSITQKDEYPLPLMEELLDRLAGAKIFSIFDLVNGYWQCAIEESDKEKTAFSPGPGLGLYEFNAMPFGLCNAPSTFQRLMDKALYGLNNCFSYMDDIIVFSEDVQTHRNDVIALLERLRILNLRVNIGKCQLFVKKIKYLGFLVDEHGIIPDPEDIEPIISWKTPKDADELRRFLGTCGVYHRFIRNYSNIAEPLFQLLKKSEKWSWEDKQREAFIALKNQLRLIPTLRFPSKSVPFIITCDASGTAIGAVLSQVVEGNENIIACSSQTLNSSKRRMSTFDREFYSIIYAVKKFRHYIYGQKIIIRCDHNPLKWVKTMKDVHGRRARWLQDLEEFDYTIEYIKGSENTVADALSRNVSMITLESQYNLANEQKADESLNRCIELIQNDEQPTQDDTEETRTVFRMKRKLKVINETLIHDSKHGLRPIIPRSLRHELFTQAHENCLSHAGFETTFRHMSKKYVWPNMKDDIGKWCEECVKCTLSKAKNFTPRSNLQSISTDEPFDIWTVDFTGPLPTTSTGNKYLIVFVDHFSKWIEALAVPDQSALTASKAFISCVISRFGIPKAIHSDMGTQFESSVFQNICQYLGIKKTRTTPYHPSGNGLVERFNRVIKERIRCLLPTTSSDWDQYIDLILMSLRTIVSSTTGFSASEIIYGRQIKNMSDVNFTAIPSQTSTPKAFLFEEYFHDLVKKLQSIRRLTIENSTKARKCQSKQYDKTAVCFNYDVGDLVLIRRQRTSKLENIYDGPYVIIEAKHPTYTIKLKNGPMKLHHDHLYPYRANPRGGSDVTH
ncbi:Transposon Ty3-I Gag-Pol polyprotein [Thelohanellus kitauei]|uniref:Transposon Ty3-I Gag-Pol polyprotein n=1 Tax=Thelohanellus kitauei TaxID=669202 RepID=A0A0C2IC97_THEKT|nr:Transposon Ty3-I Gag-Pol polyprotein [Thelohanellus kitauei]